MKKLTLLAFITLSISITSCKKAYQCECVSKETSSTTNGVANPVSNNSSTSTREISKTSKKNAQANCGNSTEVNTTSVSFAGTSIVTVSNVTKTCTLK